MGTNKIAEDIVVIDPPVRAGTPKKKAIIDVGPSSKPPPAQPDDDDVGDDSIHGAVRDLRTAFAQVSEIVARRYPGTASVPFPEADTVEEGKVSLQQPTLSLCRSKGNARGIYLVRGTEKIPLAQLPTLMLAPAAKILPNLYETCETTNTQLRIDLEEALDVTMKLLDTLDVESAPETK